MIELTSGARSRLNQYLDELRATLAGCRSVDSGDVERDVMDHIEKSLGEAPTPVDVPALGQVLHELGSPSQWIPEEEVSGLRRSVVQLRAAFGHLYHGPEDFRLAYVSVGILGLAAILMAANAEPPVPMVFVAMSFLFARAALATASTPDELGPQRWLLYPALLLVYVPLLVSLLMWPIGALTGWFDNAPSNVVDLGKAGLFPLWLFLSYVAGTTTSLWWIVLGLVAWRRPAWVQFVFYPFAGTFRRKHGLTFAAIGLVIFLLGLVETWALYGWRFESL